MSNECNLSEIASRMGYRVVPEVLEAADVPIQRGHHLAMAAGHGSGEESVYALAVGSDCDPLGGLQAIVLVPTRDRAAEVALAIQRAVGSLGLRAGSAQLRPDGSLDVGAADVHCLVARPSLLLPEVRLGRLGLGELKLLVLDGVADLEDLDEWTSAEPLLDTLPADARRVAVSWRVDDHFKELLQRQLPRGRRWPDQAFQDDDAPVALEAQTGPTRILTDLGATEEESLDLMIKAVSRAPRAARAQVRCRAESSIPQVRAALESAGFASTEAEEGWDVTAAREPGQAGQERDPETGDTVRVWFGLPLSAAALATDADDRAIAVVALAHRAQLELLVARTGTKLEFLPGSLPTAELDPLGRYRALVRARIEKGGTDAELLVLEPLVREFGTARVAAAVSDLFRRTGGGDSVIRPWADVEAASRGVDRGRAGTADRATTRASKEKPGADGTHRGARGAWTRVFIGAGNRDSVRVGDLVGAITGETGIAGGQIGKIEIRGSFSLVEIDSQVVDQVVDRLNGTAIKGRQVTVKQDRGR